MNVKYNVNDVKCVCFTILKVIKVLIKNSHDVKWLWTHVLLFVSFSALLVFSSWQPGDCKSHFCYKSSSSIVSIELFPLHCKFHHELVARRISSLVLWSLLKSLSCLLFKYRILNPFSLYPTITPRINVIPPNIRALLPETLPVSDIFSKLFTGDNSEYKRGTRWVNPP